MTDFASFLSELKERNDIVEVIGSYVKLERRGYGYWACCPFHHEKTPSFSVNLAGRYYHCFGCGVSGDVIGFIKEYENVDFMQAVQILAARVGMEVPARDDKSAEEAVAKKKKRDRLSALMRDAARFYLQNLYSGKADAHLSYLSERGLTPATVKKFGLGASLDFTSLPAHLLASGYTVEECVESGACTRMEDGRLTDAEGGRLIIPIINHLDEVIAFGGRVLHPTDRAKYKNTRETLLFNKSKNLYNLNLVKREKRGGGLGSLIMVEGYMDAISLYEAGFKNVVASMGTSLTKDQARLCKRYTETVYISYDGDFAGQKANLRGLEILKDEGLRVRVVPLPEGLDPDDVIRQKGEMGYRKCLSDAMPLIDFRIHAAQTKYDLTRTDELREFVREALSVVREAESETEREELLKKISSISGVSLGALQRDLSQPKPERPVRRPPVPVEETSRERRAARFVLCACLLSKPYALGQSLDGIDWQDEEHRVIADFITSSRKEGRVRASGIFDILPDSKELEKILDLDSEFMEDTPVAEKFFRDSVAVLTALTLQRRRQAEYEKLEKAVTAEEKKECLARIGEYTKMIKKAGGK